MSDEKHEKSEELVQMLFYAIDCIRYYERINALHDCNDCGAKSCMYVPNPGENTRINCPLWKEK